VGLGGSWWLMAGEQAKIERCMTTKACTAAHFTQAL